LSRSPEALAQRPEYAERGCGFKVGEQSGAPPHHPVEHLERGGRVIRIKPMHGKWSSQQRIEAVLYPNHEELPGLHPFSYIWAPEPHMMEVGADTVVE
jgi:hypothetical protein